MKTSKIFLLLGAIVLSSFRTGDTTLSSTERDYAVSYLQETKENLLNLVKGLSEAQLKFKATPESWSVADCIEHIALSENFLFGVMQGTLKEPANPARRSEVKMTDEQVKAVNVSRERKIRTNETLEPKSKFGSVEGSLREFKSKRDVSIEYIRTTQQDLRNHYASTPIGTLDSYQVIIAMAGHSARHTAQAREVMAHPNFPKK